MYVSIWRHDRCIIRILVSHIRDFLFADCVPRTLTYVVRGIQKAMLKARILLKQLLAEFTSIAVVSSVGRISPAAARCM